MDSGLPVVYGRTDVKYVKCSDEHGVDRGSFAGVLKVNDKLRLVPGHCDPTCNVHDWYVGVRGGVVEDGLAGQSRTRQGLLRNGGRRASAPASPDGDVCATASEDGNAEC